MSNLDERPRRIRPIASAAAALVTLVALAPAVAAGNPITFVATIGSSCVSGKATPSAPIVATLRSSVGDVMASASAVATSSGAWSLCFSEPVEVGDTITADDGPNERTLAIPRITGTIDRVTDVFSGKGPATTTFVARLYDCALMSSCIESDERMLSTDATGAVSFDYTAISNVRGQDQVQLRFPTAEGDYIFKDVYAPMTRVVIGLATISGFARPGTLVTTTLKTSADVVKGTAQVVAQHPVGNFYGIAFRKPNGTKVYVAATDKVSSDSATDAGFTVPGVTLSATISTDVISGKCRPNGPYSLVARRPNFSDSVTRSGMSDVAGNLTQDVTADLDLVAGDLVFLSCRMATGDIVERRLVVA
ncbi:MAG: hypothetical protein H0W07_06875 [Chloroflexi bacterium]|nr:hypothetical protein [Chloroflexota bacterium]